MRRFKSALIVEYGYMRLLLFVKKNGVFTYFNEEITDYDGFYFDGFKNPDDVFYKIQQLFSAVQRYGAVEKNSIVVLPGAFFKYGVDERDVRIVSGTVTKNDVEALLASCGARLQGYEAVARMPLTFRTLLNPAVDNPVGEKADRLRVTASVEYLKSGIKELFDNCARRLGKSFQFTSFGSLAAKKSEKEAHCAERTIVLLADGNIDVVACRGGVPVDVKSDMLGARHVCYSLAEELECSDEVAEEIAMGANLNLNFSPSDVYVFGRDEFSVSKVNTCMADAFIYLGGEIRNCIDGLPSEGTPAIFLTGSKMCEVRGVREIFEDETGKDIKLLQSDVLNLEGCADYVASAIIEVFKEESVSHGDKLRSVFGGK